MPNSTSNVSFRIDSTLKTQADSLFAELGLNMTTAFNIFLRKAVQEGGLPFPVTRSRIPNDETIEAILEAERISHDPNVKRYSDVEEALRELKS
jgi:DNA-damage-inducible protein J